MSYLQPDPGTWFLREVAEPTAQEFLDDPFNMRKGMLAAIVVNHALEHIFHSQQKARGWDSDLGRFRQSLAASCPEIGLLRDVADAAKHSKLSRKSAQVSSVECMSPMLVMDATSQDTRLPLVVDEKLGTFRGAFGVLIDVPKAGIHQLSTLVVNAFNYLEMLLGVANVTQPDQPTEPVS